MPESQYCEEITRAPLDDDAAFLAKRGLLTADGSEGKKMEQLQFETAQYGVVDHANIIQIRAGWIKAAHILYSGAKAAWTFRHWTFDKLLHELTRGRRTCSGNCSSLSAQEVAQLVSAYWSFRPLLPFDKHTDFVDSLTLIEYLSHYRVFPRLVIGVKLVPFTTHAWVQKDGAIFNDSPEFVRQFTPIFCA